jgi:hypothetical protein
LNGELEKSFVIFSDIGNKILKKEAEKVKEFKKEGKSLNYLKHLKLLRRAVAKK